MHGAVFDAVQSITHEFPAYLHALPAPASASTEAAAVAAAHDVLTALYAPQRAKLDGAYGASLARIADGAAKDEGVDLGRRAAVAMLSARSTDHSAALSAYKAATSVGRWRPTPPLFKPALEPGWGGVTPFTLRAGDQFRPTRPYTLTSSAYATDFNEIKSIGAAHSSSRTAEQTTTAKFWTVTAPQEWNRIAQALAAGLTLSKASRLFAVLNIAEADAAIATWDTKFTYNQWRPVTGIRSAASDGNSATVADSKWLPLIPTPPFPDYVCGHSTLGGAAENVLESFFGPSATIRLTSAATPGVVHRYTTFRAIEDEVINARVWAGIHWRTSCVIGRTVGEGVGAWTVAHLRAGREIQ